jgi:hypothetical protein
MTDESARHCPVIILAAVDPGQATSTSEAKMPATSMSDRWPKSLEVRIAAHELVAVTTHRFERHRPSEFTWRAM